MTAGTGPAGATELTAASPEGWCDPVSGLCHIPQAHEAPAADDDARRDSSRGENQKQAGGPP